MRSPFSFSTQNLKKRVASAAALNISSRIAGLLVQTVTTLVLARLLPPGDFGLVGMAMPIIVVFTIFGNLGLAMGVLQKEDLTGEQLSSLFYMNVGVSTVLAAFVTLVAPFAADFYDTPQVEPIVIIFASIILCSGLTTLQTTLLQRNLRYGVLFLAELISNLAASGLAVWMALNGFGYMSLVWRTPVQMILYGIVVWLASGWSPGRPDLSEGTRALMRFGGFTMLFRLLNTFGRQGDNVLIGWRYGHTELGPYAIAYRIFFMPVQTLISPLSNVMIVSLARLRSEPERYARWYLSVLKIATLVALPPFLALSVCADDLVSLLLGDQWAAAAPILRWLLPTGALHVSYVSIGWLMLSSGHADRQFRWELVATPAYLLSFVLGLPWKAEGVAMAYAITNVLLFIPGFAYAIRGTAIRLTDILAALAPGFATSAVLVGVLIAVFTFWSSNPILNLVVAAIIGLTILATAAGLTFGFANMLHSIRNFRTLLTPDSRAE